VGVDVVDVSRFGRTAARTPRLLERLFTSDERALPLASLAGRFAAKEAVAKALGSPGDLHWHDVEILRAPSGAPVMTVTGTVAAAADRLGVRRWHLSLSHDAGVAVAMVVAEG
jgi:holo-[acyl-carrier protein] synthase